MHDEKANNVNIEKEIAISGTCGSFEALLIGLMFLPLIITGGVMVSSIYITMIPEHTCLMPFEDEIKKVGQNHI